MAGGDADGGSLVRNIAGEGFVIDVDADAGHSRVAGKLNQDAGGLTVLKHDVVGPAKVALDTGDSGDGFGSGQAESESQDGTGRGFDGRVEDERDVESGVRFGVPGVALASDARGLFSGDYGGARGSAGFGQFDWRRAGWRAASRSSRCGGWGGPGELGRCRGTSEQLQAEAQIDCGGGVGDGSGGDEVGSGFGVGADVLQGDSAGDFDGGTPGDFADPIGGFGGREVVEQELGGAVVEGFAELGPGADFDLDGKLAGGPRVLQGLADSAGGCDVVVLNQNGVVEALAVVGDSSGGRGAFFQKAEARGGLARVEDFAVGPLDLVDKGARHGRDSAEALQEIEGGPLAFEQLAGLSANFGDGLAVAHFVAIVLAQMELIVHQRAGLRFRRGRGAGAR